MKTMTKLFGLGLLGAGVLGALTAKRRSDLKKQENLEFEGGDLDNPVVVTEEVIIVTDAVPIDAELISDEQGQQQQSFEMPGRDAGPR